MAEASSLPSPLVLKNVTVTPNVFELKKDDRFCMIGCTKRHGSIAFGALADLQRVSKAGDGSRFLFPRFYRDFSHGNYSISVVNFDQEEAKPLIIFHHENLDPSLLATALLDRKDKNLVLPVVKKRGYEAMGPSINTCSYKRSISKRRNGNDGNSAQTPSELATSLKFVWKLDPADVGSGTDLRTAHLDDLFYFLNAQTWFEYRAFPDPGRTYSDTGKVEISALTGGIYKLQAKTETIGIAINPWDVFGDAEVSSIVILEERPSDDCYALVLHGFGDDKLAKLVLPKELCLYENVYRSFYKFGDETENPYYGNNEDNVFARLPDMVFVHVLSYVPWRQRKQCRRVSKRWRAMATLAIAIDTKVIDLSNGRFFGMFAEDLNFLLPIVSNNLEEIIWSNSTNTGSTFNFEGIEHVPLFPKLRKIHINELTPDFDAFFSMLNKCPNLKELTAPIPRRPSPRSCTPGPYNEVEKLYVTNTATVTDPWLIELTDYFPNLNSLYICGYEFLSSSCISAVAEKYGNTLTRLEIEADKVFLSRSAAAASVIGAITGFESCPNLEYLSLVRSEFISDPCMAAIAAGCPKLTTLDIYGSGTITNGGLASLASLPNLARLDVSNVASAGDLSFGIAQLAKAGHLEQLLVRSAAHPSAACLKTCVRFCRLLKYVDISGSTADLTIDDAKEIIQLYGTWGLNSRLIFRSGNTSWQQEAVRIVQNDVTASFNRRFVVAGPNYRLDQRWDPEDDSDLADYEGLFNGESDYEDGDDAHGVADSDIDDYEYEYDNFSYGEADGSDFSG